MKLRKRMLSFLLCALMVLTAIPVSAQAATAEQGIVSQKEEDIWTIVSEGIVCADEYLTAEIQKGLQYGSEWFVQTMLRAGKSIDQTLLDNYYTSVVDKVKTWEATQKPTDIARTALALSAMGKDITNVDGVNLAEMLYNSEKLGDGANELAYALLALDARNTSIPEDAKWNRESIITELFKFQDETSGGFGWSANRVSADMTAMALQALAPYKNEENVAPVIEKALTYLKNELTEECDYGYSSDSSDSCATAQVLLALAALKIDVTDESQGFGTADKNMITRLKDYQTENGFCYQIGDKYSNTLATWQVMQALDGYRKAMKDNVSYWDFATTGYLYKDDGTDENPGENPGESTNAADPIDVYVTISDEGNVVVMQQSVNVIDRNKDGHMDVDEVLYAAHETFYTGGAAEGYQSENTAYGLSLMKLWGDVSGAFGYWKNNTSCWSLTDEVTEGDYVTAFVYQDQVGWSDAYSCFDSNEYAIVEGNALTVSLEKAGYDADWNTVFSGCKGAAFQVYKDGSVVDTAKYTIAEKADGKYEITFAEAGNYYLVASGKEEVLVPAICNIVCSEKQVDSTPSTSTPTTNNNTNNNNKADKETSTSVATGDSAPMMMCILVMAIAGMAVCVMIYKKKKQA